MDTRELKRLFEDTDYVHSSGRPEERKVAEYLKSRCEELGVPAHLEDFRVAMGDISRAELTVDGESIACKGFMCCGSGTVEGELYYMPADDPVSIAGAKDKIVLLDSTTFRYFLYQDLVKAGVRGIICRYGDVHYDYDDIDERDLREAVRGDAKKVLCVMIHVRDAVKLVRNGARHAVITVEQDEYDGRSQNVVAELPGKRDEWIVMTAHYDSTTTSHGAYDNMTGCAALLGAMEYFRCTEHGYGLRFVFCGSEERGLLGSKAYVQDHTDQMEKTVLNVNVDMIGTYMGHFIACVSAEEALVNYVNYMGAEVGFPIRARMGVYPSDATPFADAGVPALSFARDAGGSVAPIHCRWDLMDVLSMERLSTDIGFIVEFTRRMVNAAVCPVSRELPEKVKKELDEYLFRKRKA